VTATNVYGETAQSTAGNGATYTRVPDAPVSLTEDVSLRSSTTLGFTWADGAHDGGLAVESYRVQQREVGGAFSIVAPALTSKTYTAQSLALGTSYEFTVESYN